MLAVVFVTAVVGGLAYPVFGLMPAYADRIMGVDAVGLGILLASGALGSVLGTSARPGWVFTIAGAIYSCRPSFYLFW